MEKFDIVVIGNGSLARRMARDLCLKFKKIAFVPFGTPHDTSLYELQRWIIKGSPAPLENNNLPTEVRLLEGTAQFISEDSMRVNQTLVRAKRFVLATGVKPRLPLIPGLDGNAQSILNVLTTAELPTNIIIAGGGPVGCCVAGRLAQNGKKVTLLCSQTRVLPNEEPEIGEILSTYLRKIGVRLECQATLSEVRKNSGDSMTIKVLVNGQSIDVNGESLMLAMGFSPQIEGLGLENAGVYMKSGGEVAVNDLMQTSVSKIYAAGGVTGPPLQITKDAYQAEIVVHNLSAYFFDKKRWDYDPLPITYPTPLPFASVGMKEREARARFGDARVSLTSYGAVEKSALSGQTDGLIKLVGRRRNGTLLGVHILGPGAEEMILSFNLAMRAGLSVYDLLDRQHYPKLTYGELAFQSLTAFAETLG